MSTDLSNLSIAVVHEHYYERGGAEYVAETIARTFDAPIYTGFVNEEALPPEAEREELEFVDLFGERYIAPLVRRFSWLRDFYYQFAWQRLPELTEYDVIIQSGNNPGWYVPPEEQTVVKYVHTTPRTAYDLFHQRADSFVTKLYAYASRVLYNPNIPYPDIYVANSELVARRLTRYWGVENPEVVYPPTEIQSYTSGEHRDFYLSFSRLTADKRFDEIIGAFRHHPDKHLVIGGSGPKEQELKSLAEDMDNVEFRGYLEESEKRELLGSANALVYAAVNEDFGMVPIEAYASGTPVIGVRDGYTKYQIRDGVTGILYERGVSSLADAIEQFDSEGVEASAEELVQVSRTYGLENFRESIRETVERAVEQSRIDAGPKI
ncbi:glycosyltransferase [Halopenitus persicus]|uniref:glycosyltransferase n=1 Tax=Halopenitus persicus TaxID=1048396 RepID=UPI0012FDD8BD|nr:glycosyltransferase [Halopenitus persicus]